MMISSRRIQIILAFLAFSVHIFLGKIAVHAFFHNIIASNRFASFISNGSTSRPTRSSLLFAKKKKSGGGGRPYSGAQAPQEKQSVKDARFDSVTRQFMFTIVNLNKILPDKSKTLLKNINLCFYPGAKIGLVGLNGSGKSTLLKIMAGVDKEFEGIARPLPGASIGYLPQEPVLDYPTGKITECLHAILQLGFYFVFSYTSSHAHPRLSSAVRRCCGSVQS